MLYVFGRWQLRERRLLAQLIFVRSLAPSRARPERGAVVKALAALVGDRVLAVCCSRLESATVTVLAALAEFGVVALPSPTARAAAAQAAPRTTATATTSALAGATAAA